MNVRFQLKSIIQFILMALLLGFFMNCAHKKILLQNKVVEDGDDIVLDQSQKPLRATASTESNFNSESFVEKDFYLSKIQPIFNQRCIVCHACVEAPCTLYLNSYAGVTRGGLNDKDYTSNYLKTFPIRMKDGKSIKDWRDKGFSKVITSSTKDKGLKFNMLYRFVLHGYTHYKPNFALDGIQDYANSQRVCPKNIEEFSEFISDNPWMGMPYGLPAISEGQLEDLKTWAASGSNGPSPDAEKELEQSSDPKLIESWDQFFNNKGIKNQLFTKYIYEHSFLAHIHFDGTPTDEFYELVRSSTPFPEKVNEIVTERPIDPIENEVFYYRLKKVTETIVRKTHVLWELNEVKKAKWEADINDPSWPTPPSEALKEESENPFQTFKYVPSKLRYRFLIENSYLIVNSMIRGPVCTGKSATFAIRDHFWVMFMKPELDKSLENPELEKEWESLTSFQDFVSKGFSLSFSNVDQVYDMQSIWDGDGTNTNAFLTVFRHELSASVHKGLIGINPSTVWVVNFSNLERIYYNLVAEFKPWGSTLHQLATFKAMTRHRQEAEERFLMYFPKELREPLHNQWEEGFFTSYYSNSDQKQKNELVGNFLKEIQKRVPPEVMSNKFDINLGINKKYGVDNEEERIYQHWENLMNEALKKNSQKIAQHLPNIVFLKFENRAYTLIADRYYKFNDIVVVPQDYARNPDLDSLVMLKGLIGDRPEVFLEVSGFQQELFVEQLSNIRNKAQWIDVKKAFGKRRNDPKIWDAYDWFFKFDLTTQPLESGVMDLNYYDINTW